MRSTIKDCLCSDYSFYFLWRRRDSAAIRIVAALPDLGSIASYIGGDNVEVSAIAKASSNPHSVEVFPSYMAKVSKASVYLKCGLGLDQWSDAIIDGSRNNKIITVDCSNGISVLEKPTGKVDASLGDVHPFGNPHYWLNPENGIIWLKTFWRNSRRSIRQTPLCIPHISTSSKRNVLTRQTWKGKAEIAQRSKDHHLSFFLGVLGRRFRIFNRCQGGTVPGHPADRHSPCRLVGVIKKENVAFVIQEPYFSDDAPRFLNRQTGVKVFKCAPSCSDVTPSSYFDHFEGITNQLTTAAGGKQP